MIDFDRARQVMVDGQLRAGGITEPRLLAQLSRVPRELFVPEHRRALAYVDDLHWLGEGAARRFMPAPVGFAKLLKLAEIKPDETVLDLGAGLGYGTAVIAGLAASVTGFEPDPDLAASAAEKLASLGLANTTIVSGAPDQFVPQSFDVIIAQGMLDAAPSALLEALREGGRMVALIRRGPIGMATVFTKSGGMIATRQEFNASLPPLFSQPREEAFVF